MNTFKEENPITYRIDQMRVNWTDNICGDVQLVRWLVKKDEVRMVKAFSLLEGSEHGQIPELFLNLEIPFSTVDAYGKDLTEAWLSVWNSEEARKEVEFANVLPDWDDSPYRDCEEKNSELTFLLCMASFARAIAHDQVLVLNIVPAAYNGEPEFAEWIIKCLKKLPANIRLMVYDLEERPLFEKIPGFIKAVTLHANLKMNEAMKEMVTQGDTNNPAVGVNLCLLNLAEAANDKDEKEIHHWGEKGVKMAKSTGLKSIEATVYLAYGSAFYQLKKTKQALELFRKGEEAGIKGLNSGDAAIPSIILQTYNFQAAAYVYLEEYEKAEEYYVKTSEEARLQNNIAMFLDAKRQAAYMAGKQYKKENIFKHLEEAFEETKEEDKMYLKFSSMLLICSELHEMAVDYKKEQLADEINSFSTEIWGEYWLDLSQKEVYQTILTE